MGEQRHIIKRQVLEFTFGRTQDARWLQAEMSRIYRHRIVPLIDQYCTELSTPDRLHRIDSLELDLGAVDPQHLEDDLVARVRAQLRQQLAAQISARERQAAGSDTSLQTASQLELFSLFATTGSLPWWADASQPHLLDACLQHLMRHAPGPLRRTMRDLAQATPPLQRLVTHLDDASLIALSRLLAPALQADLAFFPQELVAVLQQTAVVAGRQRVWFRSRVWYGILHLACLRGEGYTALTPFCRELFTRVAAVLGVRDDTLIANLYEVTQGARAHFRSQLREPVAVLHRERSDKEAIGADDLMPHPEQAQATNTPPAEQIVIGRSSEVASTPADVLHVAERADAPARGAAEDIPVDLRFSDADELYIANAGLVILWPFLRHFFAHLDLLEDTQFKDAAARQRAVGLLQYLATEEASPPEYVLPLNKVLCGMEVTEVFDVDPPVSEAEAEECVNLLTAVIAQAPILRDMSIPGFRGTFLLRQGMLSSRDGAWLLRVERVTYDVVLDRFPWSVEWVKLPWTETLLRVEW